MKVISFCLYGDKLQYINGAFKNIELAHKLYPDFKCLFYMSAVEQNMSWVNELNQCPGTEICFTDTPPNANLMLDRFRPAGSNEFNVVLIRDTDSRLCEREKYAVDDWIRQGKNILILKDHPWHLGKPILGGLWGVKNKALYGILTYNMLENWKKSHPAAWQSDQNFLEEKIWPLASRYIGCTIFDPFGGGLNYPTPRVRNEFCGATHDENDIVPKEQVEMLQRYWRP